MTPEEPEQRPNSRKGIPNGESKHYGDRDERHSLDLDPEDAIARLVDGDERKSGSATERP